LKEENVKEIESKKLIALVEDHLREYKDLEKERQLAKQAALAFLKLK
jgi:hypothetical protein